MKPLMAIPFVSCCSLAIAFLSRAANCQEGEGEAEKPALRMGDRDPELLRRVNAAIVKGADWLRKQQKDDGSWAPALAAAEPPLDLPSGKTALALLALRKCGDPADFECIGKGFDWLRRQPLKKVKEAALRLLALEARFDPGAPRHVPVPKRRILVPAPEKDWMRECVEFLIENRVASGKIRGEDASASPPGLDVWNGPPGKGDHENTMFALLGLKAASRCGLEVPEEIWTRTLRHFLEVQEMEGPEVDRMVLIEDKETGRPWFKPRGEHPDRARGWCRCAAEIAKREDPNAVAVANGSMTCAGLSCVAMALEELGPMCRPDLKSSGERATWDGLAWLAHNWRIDAGPRQPDGWDPIFYLFCLAKAGERTWTRAFGRHDWYREGAEWLLARQGKDGSWDDPMTPGPVSNTCFALLFLAPQTR